MPAAAYASQSPQARARATATQREGAISDMRAFLARSRPQTPAEALRLLRNAYPEAPLSLRVIACGLAEA